MEPVHSELLEELKKIGRSIEGGDAFEPGLAAESPVPVVIINPDSSIQYVNPAFERISGFVLDELAGVKAPYPWWPEESLEYTNRSLWDAMKKGPHAREGLIKNRLNRRLWVDVVSMHVKEKGGLKYLVAGIREVTAGKPHMERAEEVCALFFESTPFAFLVMDVNGEVAYVNSAFCGLWGLDAKKTVGLAFEDLWEDGKKAREALDKLRRIGTWTGVLTAAVGDGSAFNMLVVASVARDAAGGCAGMTALFVEGLTRFGHASDAGVESWQELGGMLPICAMCKKIRDARGRWIEIENYIKHHSGVELTHGYCPECAKKILNDPDGPLE